MEILANSYFSGAGIFDIGFRDAGITIQQSFEIKWAEEELEKIKDYETRNPVSTILNF